MIKYSIYHIPDFQYSDNSIGKIGCSKQLDRRIKENKKTSIKAFQFWEILEEHTCKQTAAIREQELQKQYGYKIDSNLYKGAVARRKDYTHSEETRKKLSESLKNREYKPTKEIIKKQIDQIRGEDNVNAKLTEDKVRYIRKWMPVGGRGPYTQERMAKAMGVSSGRISMVVNRLTWKHI